MKKNAKKKSNTPTKKQQGCEISLIKQHPLEAARLRILVPGASDQDLEELFGGLHWYSWQINRINSEFILSANSKVSQDAVRDGDLFFAPDLILDTVSALVDHFEKWLAREVELANGARTADSYHPPSDQRGQLIWSQIQRDVPRTRDSIEKGKLLGTWLTREFGDITEVSRPDRFLKDDELLYLSEYPDEAGVLRALAPDLSDAAIASMMQGAMMAASCLNVVRLNLVSGGKHFSSYEAVLEEDSTLSFFRELIMGFHRTSDAEGESSNTDCHTV